MASKKNAFIIAADPGFDGLKIAMGNSNFRNVYRIPFSVINITDCKENYTKLGITADNIMYTSNGATYLVGGRARKALKDTNVFLSNSEDLEAFNKISRFSSNIFKNALMAGISYALCTYAKEYKKATGEMPYDTSDIDADLYLGIALPHKFVDKYSSDVAQFAKQTTDATIMINSEEKKVKFTPKHVMIGSQTINAIVGQTLDDFGNAAEQIELPTLVIDAGYKTVGIAPITDAMAFDGRDDSNVKFAMQNVNEKVCKIFSELPVEDDILTEEQIEEGCESYDYYDIEAGQLSKFDVKATKEKVLRETIEEFETMLEGQFKHFSNLKNIKFTGGTGKVYCEPFIQILKEKKLDSAAARTSVIDVEFAGNELDTIYAIAVGLFKNIAGETKALK